MRKFVLKVFGVGQCGWLAMCLAGVIAMTSTTMAQTSAALDDDPHMTGLRPPNVQEKDWMDKHMLRVKKVKMNKMGFDRLNDHLRKKGRRALAADTVETVKPGAELEGVVGAAADTGTASSSLPAAVPTYVDNSTLKYFPPVRSQGSIGSCVQFATVYYTLTHMTALARNWDAKNGGDDYRFDPLFTYNMVNGGADSGSWYAWNILINNGCIRWSLFPYQSNCRIWCTNGDAWRDAISYRAANSYSLSGLNAANNDAALNQVKTALNNGYIMNYGTYINSWQWKTLGNDPATTADDTFAGSAVAHCVNGTAGAHGMTLVGYNDDVWCDVNGNGKVDAGEKGAFRICNSWGTGWQQGGFAWVTYDALRMTSIVSGAPARTDGIFWYGQVQGITARASYTPRILTKVTLNHQDRSQISVSDGIFTTVEKPAQNSCLQNQGGAYAFDGGTTAIDGTFYFDVSDVAPAALTTLTTYYSKLMDSSTAGSLQVKAFTIIDVTTGGETAGTGLPATVNGTNRRFDIAYKQGSVTTYTLTATAGTGGTISPSGIVTVNSGASQTFTITPNAGYKIAGVTVDGASVGAVASYSFNNVTANHSIAATFNGNVDMILVTTGGVASASGENPPNETAAKAFDGNSNSKWLTPANVGWLQYRFTNGVTWAVTRYTLVSGNDGPGRDPKNWQLQGSNDGTTWTTLDTRTGQTFSSRFATNTYTFSNSTAYQYYRLNITLNNGDSLTQLSELVLWANNADIVPVATGGTASASGENPPRETAAKAFDGNSNSKWLTPANVGWLQYRFTNGVTWAVTQYALVSGNDGPGRDPKNWQLQGSNDGTTWTTLDTRTGQTFSSRFATNTYTFSNSTAYQYYRLNITLNNGDGLTQLSELVLWASGVNGTGLKGEYYNTVDLTGTIVLTRTDATVNFGWGGGSPAAGINVDNFSARWTGLVKPRYSETYTFSTMSDDGVRLWVNNQLIIDNWTDHSPTVNTGTITLLAGQQYSIKMEFYERGGGATAQLLWSSASQVQEVIPQSQLYPNGTAGITPALPTAGRSVGTLDQATAAPMSSTSLPRGYIVVDEGASLPKAALPVLTNEVGQVAGTELLVNGRYSACLTDKGKGKEMLGTLGGANSYAFGLNNLGCVVGGSEIKKGTMHAYMCKAHVMKDLGTLGGSWSLALGINDKDDVVGSSADSKGVEKPCVYGENGVIALDTLGGEQGRMESINQDGVSAGWSQNLAGEVRATLWNGAGEAVDLNGLIPADSGWVLESAGTIDDEGVIIGTGTCNGQSRDFTLVPRK